jgi:transcriptional regulator with XRE-family HTH domain
MRRRTRAGAKNVSRLNGARHSVGATTGLGREPRSARPVGQLVGARISALREQLRLTLDALASGTGLTPSYLSRLERGQTSISVDNLRSVATFLGVEMVHFFERGEDSRAVVTPRGSGTPLAVADSRVFGESLIASSHTELQATLYRTPAGDGRQRPFAHAGEELVFIVRGQLTYHVGGSEFTLRAGDAIWHPSTEPHRWHNHGKGAAVSLHINTPPVW